MLCRFTKSCAITLFRQSRNTSALVGFTNMEGVFVRSVPDEEKLQITVNYQHEVGKGCSTVNMERFQVEEVGKMLDRLKASMIKKVSKKKKKKKTDQTEQTEEDKDIKIWLTVKDCKVENENTPLNQVLVEGAILHIQDKALPIEINIPKCRALILPDHMMAGFPIYPKVQVEFCDLENSQFTWYRYKISDDNTSASKKKPREICEKVSESFSYLPTMSDIGFKLKLTCIPKMSGKKGEEFSKMSKCEVEAGPGVCPFENRQSYTQHIMPEDRIRVMSYNILADIYADSDFSRNELFPYCPPYALAIDYRKQLLLKEIAGYNSDVICLQEVDRKVFAHDLLPAFDVLGYEGSLQEKGGSTPEGEATFYRKTKFRLIEDCSIVLREMINIDDQFRDIKDLIATNDNVKQEIEARGTIAQVLILESLVDPQQRLCVANTHLFFHPKACCIRSLQAIIIIRYLEGILQKQNDEGNKVSLIFCGDFNCSPKGGAYEFITHKNLNHENYSWTTNPEFQLQGAAFTHSLDLLSGCGELPYTNYAKNFHEQLDYIFIDPSKFEVEQVVPLPDHSEVIQHVALPSVVFPSDHIAQICDLKWKSICK